MPSFLFCRTDHPYFKRAVPPSFGPASLRATKRAQRNMTAAVMPTSWSCSKRNCCAWE